MRTTNYQNNVNVSFIYSKNRVAPIKELTRPRLELQATVMLSQLLYRLSNTLNMSPCNIYAFSDSRVGLSWLNHTIEQPKEYKNLAFFTYRQMVLRKIQIQHC